MSSRLINVYVLGVFLFNLAAVAQSYSIDFRELGSFPSEIVAAGDLNAGDLFLADAGGEQVLAVDLSGVGSDYGSKFIIEGLNQEVNDGDPLYLYYHYKPAVPKSSGGIINFRVSLTINGVETEWNAGTQTGVINAEWPLDASDWWLAVIDMKPLVDHWREQTGSSASMFVEKIHVGPGAIGNVAEQYRDMLYFREIDFGSTMNALHLRKDGNLLDNGEFSEGLAGWSVSKTAPSDAEATVSNSANYEYYADITNDDGVNWHLQVRQQDLTLIQGEEYVLTFDARAEAARILDVQFKSGNVNYQMFGNIGIDDQMKTYTNSFTVSEATANDVRVMFFIGEEGANDVWLDNISLSAVSNPGTELISNGDLSNGTTGWQFIANAPSSGSGAVVASVSETAESELYFNMIHDDGVSWHLQLKQAGLQLKNGSTYQLSFDARAESSRTMRVNVKSDTGGDVLNFDASIGTNMSTFATDFTMEKPTADDVQLSFFMGADTNDVWLDKVSVREVTLDNDQHWIPQGSVLSTQPKVDGTVYITRYRFPLVNYADATTRLFDVAEFASHAAVVQSVSAGQETRIETEGLLSGTYDLVLVRDGVVEAAHPFHLAFTSPPVSPHYEVSVEVAGQINDLPTYYSFRQEEYIKDWGVDGKGDISYTITRPGNPQPVNAHSWGGISTDDYPVTVRVKVLPDAENDHVDGTAGITLPLTSANVLPSSYNIPCWLEGTDTIAFVLDRPEKVMVIPNYDTAMSVFTNLAAGHVPLDSFEQTYTSSTIPANFNADRASNELSEGYKNPLVFLGRGPDTFVSDLGLSKDDPTTLVVKPGDRPTQAELSAADTVWFEPGGHDLSRLGAHPSYRTYIHAGQTYYFEEGAYVAAGFKKDAASGLADCRLVGRGTIWGGNHFWGGGGYDENSLVVEVDIIDGLDFAEREGWGIDGGDLIHDIALMGGWHGNCDGLDSLDYCTVSNSFLTAHDDTLKINDHTHAEHVVIYMHGLNAHPIMFKEMWDDVVFADSVVKDVDVIGYWKQAFSGMNGWHRVAPGAIACVQTRNVRIENCLFSDIRIEVPHLTRVFSFYNLYSQGVDWPYVPDWLDIYNVDSHSSINGLIFENITVNSPLIAWPSLLGSGFADSFDDVAFVNIDINGVRVTEANKDNYFELSGYVNGTDPVDGGSGRIDIANPVQNLIFHDSLYSAWAHDYALVEGTDGDDDEDGVANLAEFALNGDPVDPSNLGTPPDFAFSDGGFSVVHPVLAKRNPGIRYLVETTDNLMSNNWTEADYTAVTNMLSGDFNSVSNRIPISTDEQQFIRLRIDME